MSDELETNNIEMRDVAIRSVNEETRTVEGIAVPYDETTTVGAIKERFAQDSIISEGDIHLYYNHDHGLPIGKVIEGRSTKEGYVVKAYVSETTMGNDVYELVKDGTIRKFSIGFMPVESSVGEGGVIVRKKARLAEVSLVPQPAYSGAEVTLVRNEQDSTQGPEDQTNNPSKEDAMENITSNTNVELDLSEVRSAVEGLERKFEMLSAKEETPAVIETRSAGELIKAYVSGQDNVLERTYAGGTTADAFIQDGFVGDLTRIVDEAAVLRNLFSKGTLPGEGNNIEFAELDANTIDVDIQSAEGDDLTFGLVSITSRTAPVKTFGGYTTLSRQEIERSSVNMVDASLRAMASAAGKALNAQMRSHFTTAVAAQETAGNKVTVPATGATYQDWLNAIVDASVKYEAIGLTLDGLIVDKATFKALMGLQAEDGRPVFLVEGQGVNNIGSVNVRTLRGSLAGVPVIMDAGLGADVVSFYNGQAITEFTNGAARLQNDNIINLSRDFSVYMYSAVATTIPAALVAVEKTA
jgi:HK97 family phage prohead protease/HK97 family phage major capsid protein